MEEYETIEHDMIHIKDYFKNYKFGIQERLSKLYFLNNMNTNKINDSNELLKQSKDKLVEIKSKGKECDQFIYELSTKFYDLNNEIDKEKKILEENEQILKNKNAEFEEINRKTNLYSNYEALNLKYKSVCTDIENILNKISDLKNELEIKKDFNTDDMEIYRNKLMSRTRRLSVIQYEKYVEDLYDFYKKLTKKVAGLFNVEIFTKSENGKIIVFCIREDKNELKIVIENGKIESIKGLGDEDKVNFYKKINDPRFVLYYFMFNK